MRAALVAALAALAASPAAGSAAPAVSFQDWFNISADFSGRSLVWSESTTVRLDPREGGRDLRPGLSPFVYYRVHTSQARLDRTRRRFVGQAEQPIALRTQIARMTSGLVVGDGTGAFVIVPASRRFAAPVVWCCDGGTETVLLSDGRADAEVPLAAAVDGGVVRMLLVKPDGAAELAAGDPTERVPQLARVPFPGRPPAGLAALARGLVAWVDSDARARLRFGVPTAAGVAGERSVRLPGEALRVWADRGLVLVAIRRATGVALARVDTSGPRLRIVWSGPTIPKVAIGEGTVVVADGRAIIAGRRGTLRQVTRARGRVAAVAASGARLAWFERIRRKGERKTVARIARLT